VAQRAFVASIYLDYLCKTQGKKKPGKMGDLAGLTEEK